MISNEEVLSYIARCAESIIEDAICEDDDHPIPSLDDPKWPLWDCPVCKELNDRAMEWIDEHR